MSVSFYSLLRFHSIIPFSEENYTARKVSVFGVILVRIFLRNANVTVILTEMSYSRIRYFSYKNMFYQIQEKATPLIISRNPSKFYLYN